MSHHEHAPHAAQLLRDLTSRGFTVTLHSDGEHIIITPASKLTDHQREALRQHRAAIVALLRGHGTASDTPDTDVQPSLPELPAVDREITANYPEPPAVPSSPEMLPTTSPTPEAATRATATTATHQKPLTRFEYEALHRGKYYVDCPWIRDRNVGLEEI